MAANKDLKSFLENILRENEKDNGLVITSVEEVEGSRQGDGFMSEVSVANVTGKTGSGILYSNTVFIKRPFSNQARAELFYIDQVFRNESTVYLDILPLIPEGRTNIPKCFYASEDCIVLENLHVQGYKTVVEKAKGLDLAHSELVMKALANFHASTYRMKLLDGDNFFQKTSKLFSILSNTTFTNIVESSLITAIVNLNHVDDKSITTSITKLESFKGRIMPTLEDMHKSDIIVLGHGDFSMHNLMFLYLDGAVQDVRIIDFQGTFPMSPAPDLWKYLYTCLLPDMLNNHCDHLISIYCDNFRKALERLNLEKNEIPNEEVLKREIYSRELYGFLVGTLYIPAAYIDFSDKSLDIDKYFSDPDFIKKSEGNVIKEYGKRLAALLKRCQSRNIL